MDNSGLKEGENAGFGGHIPPFPGFQASNTATTTDIVLFSQQLNSLHGLVVGCW